MGLSLSVTCAAETLVFYFLPQLLRLGMRACMHLVFLAFLVRMACYAALRYAPSPWLVSSRRLHCAGWAALLLCRLREQATDTLQLLHRAPHTSPSLTPPAPPAGAASGGGARPHLCAGLGRRLGLLRPAGAAGAGGDDAGPLPGVGAGGLGAGGLAIVGCSRHLPILLPSPTAACPACLLLSTPRRVYFGVGVGVGTLAGGHVFHRHGAQAVYLVACAVLAAGWLLTSAAQLALRLSGRRPGRDKYLQVPAVELGELQPAEGQA